MWCMYEVLRGGVEPVLLEVFAFDVFVNEVLRKIGAN